MPETLTGMSRADVAERAGLLGNVNLRERFRLLTDAPIPGHAGTVIARETLPRTLQTLQLVRVVPISAGNVEGDFNACGLAPVAVPTDRRPPPPRLDVKLDPESGEASIVIDAPGLNRALLRHAEPGLFENPPAADARRPEFRLRRATKTPSDPFYVREILRGALQFFGVDSEETFRAEVHDGIGGLVPFVRYEYWAEVRMPPERRTPLGREEVAIPGGVTGTIPEQMLDMPGLFSGLSAAAYAMWTPTEDLSVARRINQRSAIWASRGSRKVPSCTQGDRITQRPCTGGCPLSAEDLVARRARFHRTGK